MDEYDVIDTFGTSIDCVTPSTIYGLSSIMHRVIDAYLEYKVEKETEREDTSFDEQKVRAWPR